jgi:hypothetical protein
MLDVDADAALLSRLLAPFARRSLTPDRMWSHRSGRIMHVEIAMETMPETEVPLVEGNLRQVVGASPECDPSADVMLRDSEWCRFENRDRPSRIPW